MTACGGDAPEDCTVETLRLQRGGGAVPRVGFAHHSVSQSEAARWSDESPSAIDQGPTLRCLHRREPR